MLDMLKGNYLKLVLAFIIAVVLTKMLSPIIAVIGGLFLFAMLVVTSYFTLLFLKNRYNLFWLK